MKVKVHLLTYICFIIYALSGYISFIFPLIIVLLFHELGHIIAIYLFKHKINKIEVFPFGFVIEEKNLINSNIYEELVISLSGIFMQGIFIVIIKLFFNNYDMSYYIEANIFIMIFNLIPAYPLDGYKAFSCVTDLLFPYKKTFILKFFINIIMIFFMIFYFEYSFIMIDFLLFKLISELKKYGEYYQKFIFEKIIYKLKYKKIRIINNSSISNMYRNSYHYFNISNQKVREEDILIKRIDKKP